MDIRINYAETVAGNLMKLISVPESRDPPKQNDRSGFDLFGCCGRH